MLETIKAKETRYNGYRFRSRLEARWAVFFDTLHIKYEYEKEGYELGEAGSYLPDFWLPQVKMWAEVKADEPTAAEDKKMQELLRLTGYKCLRLIGVPEDKVYLAWAWSHEKDEELWLCEYCLTNYHGYPKDEGRFYSMPGSEWDSHWEDTAEAAVAARSARFEFGERGR
jgi:hypothetical protein